MQYLLESGEASALVIAKNLGLKSTKQVTPTLYALEKQGDVTKNGDVTPVTWELSKHRRERMERSLKASQGAAADVKQEDTSMEEDSKAKTQIPGLEPIPFLHNSPAPPRPLMELQTRPGFMDEDDDTNGGQWASDDIPEFLNAIRRDPADAMLDEDGVRGRPGTVAVSLAAPPPQNIWAKLQEVRLKNPVSGLMEYAQYLGQNCEFQLLDQSGPSHDPRFRMQVMLDGRLFPVAEGNSKKVAKKDAAAATLRILVGENMKDRKSVV